MAFYTCLLQGVYLGFDHLRPFSNEKLYKLWTDYNSSTAEQYIDVTNATSATTNYKTSLWQLGNDFITAGRCVQALHGCTAVCAGLESICLCSQRLPMSM